MRRRGSLVAVLVAVGAVLVPATAHAIPAFARKYGLACSACHTNWPRLNRFGINFRDNGYRMNRERDNPVTQGSGYFPLAFRSTVGYEFNSNTLQPVAPTASNPNGLATTTTGTFGFLGLDILTAGTLGEQIGFLLVVEAQLASASFNLNAPEGGDLESAWVVFTRLFGTPYLNVRVGKGALTDLPIDQHRSYQLTQLYQIYFFEAQGSSVTFAPGSNYNGVEIYGHNELDNFRFSAALLNADSANPFWSANWVSNPTLWAHVQYYMLTGNDFLAAIEPGVFGALGWAATRGRDGRRARAGDYLQSPGRQQLRLRHGVQPRQLLPHWRGAPHALPECRQPADAGRRGRVCSGQRGTHQRWPRIWTEHPRRTRNGWADLSSSSYTPNPDWTFAFLYNRVVTLQQGSTDFSKATGDFWSYDFLVRYNVTFSSRAAVALQAEFSQSATTQLQGTLRRGWALR